MPARSQGGQSPGRILNRLAVTLLSTFQAYPFPDVKSFRVPKDRS